MRGPIALGPTKNDAHADEFVEQPKAPQRSRAARAVSLALLLLLTFTIAATTLSRTGNTRSGFQPFADQLKGLVTPNPELWGPVFLPTRVPCFGPWTEPVELQSKAPALIAGSLPRPFAGSYSDLRLPFSWTTAAQRYGRYGYSVDSEIDWDIVNWAALQDECLLKNLRPGITTPFLTDQRKLPLPAETVEGESSKPAAARPKITTGRSAIILRGWSTFEFKDQDLWNIRALITETALRGGRYTIFLLVDVKGEYDVMNNATQYEEIMQTVPLEFRGMTLLFDQKNFLRSWYPKVTEHRPEFQMEQARQIFAHAFPEFDNFWQFELDVRFSGDAGEFIDATEEFARNEPRKQARERSSFLVLPESHGSYDNFTRTIDQVLEGGSSFYAGIPIPDVMQIGPQPPGRPEDDDFIWGKGEDADVIVTGVTMNVTISKSWSYKNWIDNFEDGVDTPRVSSAPGISRCSWNLLTQMHESQVWNGTALPSEATPISFALWSNLKISRPPLPVYGGSSRLYTAEEIDIFSNGGPPTGYFDGMAIGQYCYQRLAPVESRIKDLGWTWEWTGDFPGHAFHLWLEDDTHGVETSETAGSMLHIDGGHVYMPSLMLHPVKSNPMRPPNPEVRSS